MTDQSKLNCHLCETTPKKWNGADRKCAFSGSDRVFDSEVNWNCATINKLRDICDPDNGYPVDFKYYGDDRRVILDVSDLIEDMYELWVGWYKQRGRTEAMWLLSTDRLPRKPTEDEIIKVVDHFKKGGKIVD